MNIYEKVLAVEKNAANLSKELSKKVLGQDHLFPLILNYLKRGESGLTSPKLPKGSFISLGPTGVGKTETIKVIVDEFFKDSRALVRLNMSEYKTVADMKQFLGTATTKGFLQRELEAAGSHGRILLLDELEKANPEIFDLLLQILDEGFLQFHNGDSHDFRNWYVWATSNIGAKMATQGLNPSPKTMNRAFRAELAKSMRPEIVERFNCVLTYMRLSTESQSSIAALLISSEIDRLNALCGTDFQPENMEQIITYARNKGYTKALGARRMRKTVQESLQGAYYDAASSGIREGKITATIQSVRITE